MSVFKIFSQIDINPDDIDIPMPDEPGSSTVADILSTVFVVAAGIALIVIIIAGIRFMLSRGDPQKTAQARNTIIYAAVGLIVMALAFSIVQLVARELS